MDGMQTEDDENPIIAAINARRAGALSRADMVAQLVNVASRYPLESISLSLSLSVCVCVC